MKYCSYCRGNLTKQTSTKYVCDNCDAQIFRNPKAAAGIFLLDSENNICFAERGEKPHIGKLDCIGGFVEWGESLEQALFREMYEEAGITKNDIEDVQYLGSGFEEYEWNGYAEPVGAVYFYSTLKPGVSLRATDDIAAIKRQKMHEVKVTDFAWKSMRDIYPKFKKLWIKALQDKT